LTEMGRLDIASSLSAMLSVAKNDRGPGIASRPSSIVQVDWT
jgi:hypothetical protein